MKARVTFSGEAASITDSKGTRWSRYESRIISSPKDIERYQAEGGFSVEVLPDPKPPVAPSPPAPQKAPDTPAPVAEEVPAPPAEEPPKEAPAESDDGEEEGEPKPSGGVIDSSAVKPRPPVPRRKG